MNIVFIKYCIQSLEVSLSHVQPQPALVITLLNGFSENSIQPLQIPDPPCNAFLYALQIIGKIQHETGTVGLFGSLNLNTMHVSF